MIVHFTTSKESLAGDIKSLRIVLKTIRKENHTIANNWIDGAYRKIKLNRAPNSFTQLFHQSMEDVAKADVMIAEVTHSSFGVGYQVASAMQQKKPIFLLSKKGAKNDSLVRGLDDTIVKFCEYDEKNLEQLIKNFLADNDVQAKDLRFNFFIDRQIYNYLRWVSAKTGKPKAEILREFVLKEINKNDD